MAKTNFSNLQTQYASPHTHILEDVGVWLMKGCFRPMRIVTLKPEEHGPLVPTAEKVMVIKQEQQLNWAANFLASASPWKARVVKYLLAVASVPFIPFTLLGAAFVVLFRNHLKIIEKTWWAHLKTEKAAKPCEIKAMIQEESTALAKIIDGNIDGVSEKTFRDCRTLITRIRNFLNEEYPSSLDPNEQEAIGNIRQGLRTLEWKLSKAVESYTLKKHPPIPVAKNTPLFPSRT